MSDRGTFLHACLAGAAEVDDVDDWVDDWHDSAGHPRGFPEELHEYLGFSRLEYAALVEKPSLLHSIVAGRAQGRALDDAREHGSAADLVAWLRSTGRVGTST